MFTIGGRKTEVPELTWKEFKALLKLLGTELFNRREKLEELAEAGATEFMELMPELVTQALALALRMSNEQIDEATPSELLEIIPEVIKVNRIKENLEKAKKIKGLLPTPQQGPQTEVEADQASKEIGQKMGATPKPS